MYATIYARNYVSPARNDIRTRTQLCIARGVHTLVSFSIQNVSFF